MGTLTEGELRAVLTEASWPVELHDEAVSVARKESGWRVAIVNSIGCCAGLFQLHVETWGAYCGMTLQQLRQAVENARCAYMVYRYDIDRGRAPWTQWSTKP